MDAGFIVNDATVAGVTTTYVLAQAVLLHEDAAIDANSKAMPQAVYVSHADVVVDETVATCATLSAMLTWDAAGNEIMAGPSNAAPVAAGMTDISLRMCTIKFDGWPRAPAVQTTKGKCYMFLKTDAGTVTVTKVRLYWLARQ